MAEADESLPGAPAPSSRTLVILFTVIMLAACLIALVATALYLTGAFITGPAIPEFTR